MNNILQKKLQTMSFVDRVIIGLIMTAVCLLLGNIACLELSFEAGIEAKIQCVAIVLAYTEFVVVMFFEQIQGQKSPVANTRLGNWVEKINAVWLDIVAFVSGTISVAITVAASFAVTILLLRGEFFSFASEVVSWIKGASPLQQNLIALYGCGYISSFILYGEKALADFEKGMDRLLGRSPFVQ